MNNRFTNKELAFMESLGLDYDFNNLTDDEWVELEDTVATKLETEGLNELYEPNEIGLICEEILSKLS